MLRKITFLILLFGFLLPLPAFAQEDEPFASVLVQLWPEFDQPSVLVMYQITLSPQLRLPAEVRIRIPAVAGRPNAVATCELDAPCNNAPFSQNPPEGEWSELVIPITFTADLRVEYYDPRLDKNGAERSFLYIWPGEHAVDSFLVQVQQPLRAAGMRIKPGTFQTAVGEDGMNYHSLNIGSVSTGQQVELTIEYTKDNDELSNNSLPVAPSEPLENETGLLPLSQRTLTVLLALLGTLFIVVGGVWYWMSGRKPVAAPASRRRTRRRSTSEADEPRASDGAVYCHQCGHRASAGDAFCRTCGTALRKS